MNVICLYFWNFDIPCLLSNQKNKKKPQSYANKTKNVICNG